MRLKKSNFYTNSNFDFLTACHKIKFDKLYSTSILAIQGQLTLTQDENFIEDFIFLLENFQKLFLGYMWREVKVET